MAYNCEICKEIFIEPGEDEAWQKYRESNPDEKQNGPPVIICDPCSARVKKWWRNSFGLELSTYGPTVEARE